MLECFYETMENTTVRRKCVYYFPAAIFLIDQPCLNKTASVLGNRLKISSKLFCDSFDCNVLLFRHNAKNKNAVMIGDALEMPFHLLCCFWPLLHHVPLYIILSQYSNILQNVGIL